MFTKSQEKCTDIHEYIHAYAYLILSHFLAMLFSILKYLMYSKTFVKRTLKNRQKQRS